MNHGCRPTARAFFNSLQVLALLFTPATISQDILNHAQNVVDRSIFRIAVWAIKR